MCGAASEEDDDDQWVSTPHADVCHPTDSHTNQPTNQPIPVTATHHARRAPAPPLRAATTPPSSPSPEEPPYAAMVLKDVMQLLERTLDTVEDIGVHLRRATERDLDRRFRKDRLSTKSAEKKRVMVLGTGGWVGAPSSGRSVGRLIVSISWLVSIPSF